MDWVVEGEEEYRDMTQKYKYNDVSSLKFGPFSYFPKVNQCFMNHNLATWTEGFNQDGNQSRKGRDEENSC